MAEGELADDEEQEDIDAEEEVIDGPLEEAEYSEEASASASA